jgi:hypothetical protein
MLVKSTPTYLGMLVWFCAWAFSFWWPIIGSSRNFALFQSNQFLADMVWLVLRVQYVKGIFSTISQNSLSLLQVQLVTWVDILSAMKICAKLFWFYNNHFTSFETSTHDLKLKKKSFFKRALKHWTLQLM